ncbi:MAG: XdhC family protein [Hyphomicrobiaceae bacterium]
MKRSLLDQLIRHKEQRTPVALITWLAHGRQELIQRGDSPGDEPLAGTLDEAFRTDRSRTIELAGEDVFIHVHNPPLRLVIIGAVHIAQALIPIAEQAGYDVLVIDPRTAFASEERFSGVPRDARWPDEALQDIKLDARTAFVALTHDPKIDDPALKIALASDVFYIGALGSKRTHAKRVDRLTESGLAAKDLARINAPIGLDIGAIGPNEIAIAIIAEITAALRGKVSVAP